MTISTERLLALLHHGCTITTFYRMSTKTASQSTIRLPQGFILVSQTGKEESILTPAEFQSIKHLLTEYDTWEEQFGTALYGGSRWSLQKN